MRSSRAALLAWAIPTIVATAQPSRASAQQPARGFAVERFYPSAPGGGWLVMDTLDMRGALGGAIALSSGYAHAPLRVASSDGATHLAVVSAQSFVAVSIAATYDRYRLYIDLTGPLSVDGESGSVGNYAFTAPAVHPGNDSLSDARIGFDARLVGGPTSAFRLGAGAQLIVPSGVGADYVTDETYRAMGRVLFAGDAGVFTYAGHVGVHIRPRDDSPTPGGPNGSELLFGAAAGSKVAVGSDAKRVFVLGPEVFGATPFRSFFGTTTTALEALLSARLEGTAESGGQLRVKLGAGGGLNPHNRRPRVADGLCNRALRSQ